MPAEQTGLVRENYLWRVLQKRGTTSEANFLHAACGNLDMGLFLLAWGPTVIVLEQPDATKSSVPTVNVTSVFISN